MATSSEMIEGFGQVSRRLDVAFRYLLLGATLVGIVTLAILLLYVANDAIRPFTADTGWLLTVLFAVVVPSCLIASGLAWWNLPALKIGVLTIGVGIVGFLFAAGMAIVFLDIIPPLVWLAYVVALAVPYLVVLATERVRVEVPYLARVILVSVVLIGSTLVLPGVITGLPVVPTDASVLLVTVSAPLAVLLGRLAGSRWKSRRRGFVAGFGAFLLPSLGLVLGPLVNLDPLPGVILGTMCAVPIAAFVTAVIVDKPTGRIGLVLPAVLIAGVIVAWLAVEMWGFAGPNSWVDWQFLTATHSRNAVDAGFYPAIGGSIVLMVIVALLSFPLGVGSAIYLEEYAPRNRFTRIIDVNIANLAGVPSVVYGLLGLGVFVTYLGQPPGTALVGGATLALLILPIVIIASREAIRSVPDSLRAASDGLGATRWQTVRNVVLPRAFPGILTGTILSLGRAIGETAPLIMIGAPNVFFSLPGDLQARVGAMPLQIYAWASLFAGPDFYTRVVPAGVVVLLVVLLAMNSVAIALRNTYQTRG